MKTRVIGYMRWLGLCLLPFVGIGLFCWVVDVFFGLGVAVVAFLSVVGAVVVWSLLSWNRCEKVEGCWFTWLCPGLYLGPWEGKRLFDGRNWRRVMGPFWVILEGRIGRGLLALVGSARFVRTEVCEMVGVGVMCVCLGLALIFLAVWQLPMGLVRVFLPGRTGTDGDGRDEPARKGLASDDTWMGRVGDPVIEPGDTCGQSAMPKDEGWRIARIRLGLEQVLALMGNSYGVAMTKVDTYEWAEFYREEELFELLDVFFDACRLAGADVDWPKLCCYCQNNFQAVDDYVTCSHCGEAMCPECAGVYTGLCPNCLREMNSPVGGTTRQEV